ncbi:MAG: cyclic nucleotide-binding domain-containing protein [Spirochaetota bacterium]|nr:cyclic nucleotide-binding domain-containing protein [Spirochaetota bacterium]
MENSTKKIIYSPGATLLVENSLNEGYFYIIQKGTVSVHCDIDFNDRTLLKHDAGDTYGLVSGLTQNPVRYTLVADTDCEVIRIPLNMLGSFLHKNREICLKIISLYSNQLRALNNYLVSKHPGSQDLENPKNLLNIAESYIKMKQYSIAAHCLSKYIEWAKDNQSEQHNIEKTKKLLNKIAPDYRIPVADTKILSLEKDYIIFAENEPADYFYVIEEGAVKISKLVDGQEFILSILREGEIFGEMAILNKKVRNASAIVFEKSVVLRLSVDTFMDEIGEKIIQRLFTSFARRIWYAHKRASLVNMHNPNARLYNYLQILISDIKTMSKNKKTKGREYIFNFNLLDLKRMIGLTDINDESINDFLTDDNIEISNQCIRIIDSRKIDDRALLYKSREGKTKIYELPT